MLSERPWKPPANPRLLAVVLFCAASVAMKSQEPPEEDSLLNLVLSSLALHGPILLAVGIFLKGSGISWNRAFGFSTPPVGRALLLGLIAAIVFLPIGMVLQDISVKVLTWSHFSTPQQAAVEEFNKNPAAINRAYLAFFAIVIAPFVEEILFRGVVYAFLKLLLEKIRNRQLALADDQGPRGPSPWWPTKLCRPSVAMVLSAIPFAAIHLSASIFLPILLLGIVLAWLYEKTGNLLAPIATHMVFNAINVVLLLYGDNLDHLYEQHFH
jgi:membrane protease YdiL (CAAX protease family)